MPGTMLLSLATALALAATGSVAGAAGKPHIFHVIVDDLGFGNTNYNRVANDSTPEVQTPFMDALVEDGIRLNRHCTCVSPRVNDGSTTTEYCTVSQVATREWVH